MRRRCCNELSARNELASTPVCWYFLADFTLTLLIVPKHPFETLSRHWATYAVLKSRSWYSCRVFLTIFTKASAFFAASTSFFKLLWYSKHVIYSFSFSFDQNTKDAQYMNKWKTNSAYKIPILTFFTCLNNTSSVHSKAWSL